MELTAADNCVREGENFAEPQGAPKTHKKRTGKEVQIQKEKMLQSKRAQRQLITIGPHRQTRRKADTNCTEKH